MILMSQFFRRRTGAVPGKLKIGSRSRWRNSAAKRWASAEAEAESIVQRVSIESESSDETEPWTPIKDKSDSSDNQGQIQSDSIKLALNRIGEMSFQSKGDGILDTDEPRRYEKIK